MASALILFSAALFGLSNIFAKVAYAHAVTPFTFLALRATFGSLITWLALAFTTPLILVPWARVAPLLLLGLTIMPFQTFAYFYALSVLPASSASVIVNTAPAHVAWMGWWFLGEPPQAIDVAVLVTIVGGAILVAGQTPTPKTHTGPWRAGYGHADVCVLHCRPTPHSPRRVSPPCSFRGAPLVCNRLLGRRLCHAADSSISGPPRPSRCCGRDHRFFARLLSFADCPQGDPGYPRIDAWNVGACRHSST